MTATPSPVHESRLGFETRPSMYRWVVLIACLISFTLTSVDRSTWGPASTFVGDDLGVPLASLGSFATAYYIGYVVSNVLCGIATDLLGGKVILTVSLFGAGGFMFLFGSTTSAAVGIAVQAAVGFFAGADYAAGVRLIATWFPKKLLGLPMGVFTMATSLGTAFANAIVPTLIGSHGWQASYHLFGGISMAVALLLVLLIRTGPLLPAKSTESKRGQGRAVTRLAFNRDFVLLCLAGFGVFWGLYGFVVWANALMTKGYDVEPTTAGFVVAVFAVTAACIKPIVGFVTDKFFGGARKVPIMVIMGGFGVMLVIFGNLSSPTAFMIAAPFLGAFAYAWSPLIVALVPKIVSGAITGTAAGTANGFWQIGSILVPMAVGTVFAATDSFDAAFWTLAMGPFLGILFMIGVRENDGVPQGERPRA